MKVTMLGTGHGTATECYNARKYLSEGYKKYVKNSEWLFADAYRPSLKAEEKKYRHSTVEYNVFIPEDLEIIIL